MFWGRKQLPSIHFFILPCQKQFRYPLKCPWLKSCFVRWDATLSLFSLPTYLCLVAPNVTELTVFQVCVFSFSLSGPRPDIYLKFGWQFFCYQIHFRCTDESRVIVFQYYISDSLPPGQPYSVVILKKR